MTDSGSSSIITPELIDATTRFFTQSLVQEPKTTIPVNAARPQLIPLSMESLSTWIELAESSFRTAGIEVERTMVDYAIHVVPPSVQLQISLKSILEATNPWTEFKAALLATQGTDPWGKISKVVTDNLTGSSAMARHKEIKTLLDGINLEEEFLKWSIGRLVPVAHQESFRMVHGSKDSTLFAQEVDAVRLRVATQSLSSGGISGIDSTLNSVQKSKAKSRTEKLLCYYHEKWGDKALKCLRCKKCPPLKRNIHSVLTPDEESDN